MASIVIGSIQLGATVDYAILDDQPLSERASGSVRRARRKQFPSHIKHLSNPLS
ncbi:MAG: hypothetical protein ACLTJ5_11395 [Clostridium sp.]